MPKIQTYDSQVNPQPMDVVPQQTGLYTNGGKAFSEVAKQVDDITQKFREIRNLKETSKASTDLQVELSQIEKQAQEDPNFNDPTEYQQRIDDAMARHSQSITEPAVREKAMDSFRLKSYSTFSDIQTNFRRRQIEDTQYNLAREIDASRLSYINTADPAKKQLFMDTALQRLDDSVKAGVLTAEAATSMRRYIGKDWAKSEAMHDAETNPDLALVTFSQGGYPGLDTPDERKKFFDFAQSMKKRNDTQVALKVKAEQIGNEVNLISAVNANQMQYSASEVSQMIANQEISPKFGEAWLGYMTDATVVSDVAMKNPGFVSHVENVLKAGSKQEINNALQEVLARKDVKQNEIGAIVYLAKQRQDSLIGIDAPAGIKTGSKQPQVDGGLKDILQWSKSMPDTNATLVVKEYLNNLSAGEQPASAVEKAKAAEIFRQFPELSSQNIIPNNVYSAKEGLFYVFSKDVGVTPHAIYNPKTGGFDPNPNNAESKKK